MRKEMIEKIEKAGWTVNSKGFVDFKNRNWSYRGDKSSWVMVTDNGLRFNRGKGVMTDAYSDELEAFKAQFSEYIK